MLEWEDAEGEERLHVSSKVIISMWRSWQFNVTNHADERGWTVCTAK